MRRRKADQGAPAARPRRPGAPGKPKKLRRPGVFGFLRDVAGNATTETVIMIPVFIAIWGSIFYTHQRYRKALNMAQYTRAHVWEHAFNHCAGSSNSTRISEYTDSSSEGFLSGTVDTLFGSGILPGLSFDQIEGRRDVTVERPAVLGEGTVSLGHNLVVLCNEERQGTRNWATAAWDFIIP